MDWAQQEFGIAAALSGDPAMQAAYLSGDPYLTFAKQAGAVPADATKQTHGPTRELFKACVLGVQYGMEANSLAGRIGQPPIVARDLLRAHRETYRPFWRWSDAAVDDAMLTGSLHTVFGWHIHVGSENPNPRSLRNFPMQANGAEMLRLACCLATERGIEVCAPVHDAVLICCAARAPRGRHRQHAGRHGRSIEDRARRLRIAHRRCAHPLPRPLQRSPRHNDVAPGHEPDRQAPASSRGKRGSVMPRDPFDLQTLRVDPTDGEIVRLAKVPAKIVRRRRQFIKVP